MKRIALFSAYVGRRIAASHLGIILEDFARDLEKAGYFVSTIREYLRVAEHFSLWLERRHVGARQITTELIGRFVRVHLPRCRCPKPANCTARTCRTALHRLLDYLQRRGVVIQNRERKRGVPCACWLYFGGQARPGVESVGEGSASIKIRKENDLVAVQPWRARFSWLKGRKLKG